METYLKRTYKQRKAKDKQEAETEAKSFPFWDYRSRRGSLTTSTCTSSSGSSYDGCSLSSLSSVRSADTASINSSVSSSESDSSMVSNDPQRLTLQFLVDPHEILPLIDLYQPVVEWIDRDLHIFKVTEKVSADNLNQSLLRSKNVSRMPSIAVMLFLEEEGVLGYERIQGAKRRFEKPPWKFHHSEQVGQGKINLYPYNSADYFYTSEDLPLWAVRQVHYGKEHVRIVLFVSDEHWLDMLHFYKLVIGCDPDIQKEDFCYFTVHSHINYDVQFALKKLKGETTPRVLDSVKLQFRVSQVGNMVPLFPNICKPVSDRMWETTDHDGNNIVLDVIDTVRMKTSTPSECSASSRSSRPSSNSSRSSIRSLNSVQSLTSVTSSVDSSMSSISSDSSNTSSKTKEAKLPRSNIFEPPKLPEKPNKCIAALQGFYV